MRVFWGVITLLMVAAAAWLFVGREGGDVPARPPAGGAQGPASGSSAARSDQKTPPVVEHGAGRRRVDEPGSGLAEPQEAASAKPENVEETAAIKPSEKDRPASPAGGAGSSAPSGAPPIVAPKTEPSPEPTAPQQAAPGAADKSAEPDPTAPVATDPPKPTPPNIEIRADGTAVVDGKYTLKGKGIKEEPYKVTWDQLVSAQDDYVPKDGRKEIPARIGMLDGKWVELTGYIAFPVMADSQEECLSMMNQWDGCCIGIPPTPYDAVEVHLREPLIGNARLASYGVVRGRLKVEPQLVGGWLIGLYVMDDATLSAQAYGGIAP